MSPSLLFHVCILPNWPLEEFACVYMSHWLMPSFRAWPCTVLFPHVLISLPKMSISLDTSWTFAHSSNPTQMPLVLWKFPCGSRQIRLVYLPLFPGRLCTRSLLAALSSCLSSLSLKKLPVQWERDLLEHSTTFSPSLSLGCGMWWGLSNQGWMKDSTN